MPSKSGVELMLKLHDVSAQDVSLGASRESCARCGFTEPGMLSLFLVRLSSVLTARHVCPQCDAQTSPASGSLLTGYCPKRRMIHVKSTR